MLRGDWRIFITLVGCLALAWLGLTDTYERRYNEQRADSTRQQTDQIDRNRAGLPAVAEGYISNPDPKDTDERERRDLAAQEASAVWAFWVVVVSLLGTGITALGTVLLYQQIILTRRAVEDTGEATEAMREANEIARAGLDRTEAMSMAQVRAYVSILGDTATLEHDPENNRHAIIIKGRYVNSGQSPAQALQINCTVANAERPAFTHGPFMSFHGNVKANSEEFPFEMKISIDDDKKWVIIDPQGFGVIAVQVDIRYGDVFGVECGAGFIFDFWHRSDGAQTFDLHHSLSR